MYLVIVGAGDTGTSLIDLAVNEGNEVVVIEQNRKRAEAASDQFDCLVLHDDATNNGTLTDAGVDRADAVISTTDVDAVNIMVMLLAREHDVPNLVSVVHDRDHIPIFEQIGATLVENPQQLIASHLYHSVRYPGVLDFIDLGDNTELIETTVESGSLIAGQLLATAKEDGLLPEEALIVALKRGEEIISPKGGTRLDPGDEVTIITHDADLKDTVDVFTADESHTED